MVAVDHGVIIITGANSGIGRATARALGRAGEVVVMACRDLARGEAARAALVAENPDARLHVLRCDLADLASVRAFAAELSRRFPRVRALVHNAGVYPPERTLSRDGFELMLAVGFLGPFLLTHLLEPALQAAAPARVVQLAGIYHRRGGIDLGDLQWERRAWDRAAANNQVQLARVVFTVELARRLAGLGVTANAVHPGAVLTEALDQAPWYLRLLAHTLARPGFVGPDRGAAPVVALATAPELADVSGKFFDRFTVAPHVPAALDVEVAGRLWSEAGRLVGVPA